MISSFSPKQTKEIVNEIKGDHIRLNHLLENYSGDPGEFMEMFGMIAKWVIADMRITVATLGAMADFKKEEKI